MAFVQPFQLHLFFFLSLYLPFSFSSNSLHIIIKVLVKRYNDMTFQLHSFFFLCTFSCNSCLPLIKKSNTNIKWCLAGHFHSKYFSYPTSYPPLVPFHINFVVSWSNVISMMGQWVQWTSSSSLEAMTIMVDVGDVKVTKRYGCEKYEPC